MAIKTDKKLELLIMLKKENYVITKITERRINNYIYQENTVITKEKNYIKISSKTNITGVYNILIIYADGTTDLKFEFK